MGHYDSCYEHDYEENEKKLCEEYKCYIKEDINKLNSKELKLVHNIVKNASSFIHVFNIINKFKR